MHLLWSHRADHARGVKLAGGRLLGQLGCLGRRPAALAQGLVQIAGITGAAGQEGLLRPWVSGRTLWCLGSRNLPSSTFSPSVWAVRMVSRPTERRGLKISLSQASSSSAWLTGSQ